MRTAADTASTPSATMPAAWPRVASSRSTPTRRATRTMLRWAWMRPATSSSPGRAKARTAADWASTPSGYNAAGAAQGSEFRVNTYTTGGSEHFPAGGHGFGRRLRHRLEQRRGRQRLRRLCAALQFERRGPGERVPGQYLHDRRSGHPLGGHGCGRRLRRRLDELRPGRQRLRRLRPAVQRHGRATGERVPRQYLHDRQSTPTDRGHGFGRRLRHRLGQPRGRQRLRRLRPALQRGRRGPGERVPGQYLHNVAPGLPLGGHGFDRRLRRRLGEPRPGRQPVRHLRQSLPRAAIQPAFGHQRRQRVPGQYVHDRRPKPAEGR